MTSSHRHNSSYQPSKLLAKNLPDGWTLFTMSGVSRDPKSIQTFARKCGDCPEVIKVVTTKEVGMHLAYAETDTLKAYEEPYDYGFCVITPELVKPKPKTKKKRKKTRVPSIKMWLVANEGVPYCARSSQQEAKIYASGFSSRASLAIIPGKFVPNQNRKNASKLGEKPKN